MSNILLRGDLVMKVISFYLPQFHEVEENNRWWGDGFTDWRPTREAVPMFSNHYQPHIPLNNNYYDLNLKQTMEWQAELMKKYGVDGQAIYHYWFKDGKKILEKPAENLLEWKDIDMPFCFYWANESWIRSWSKLRQVANPWMNDEKPSSDVVDDGVLLLQDYGDEDDWRIHFNYLLPFFKDDRYIKIDGKPLFIIYRSTIIPKLKEMISCWREWSVENGLKGLYIIGAYRDGHIEEVDLDAQLFHEPPRTNIVFFERNRTEGVTQINYDEIWNYVLSEYSFDCKTYYSGFTGYDDSPRRGTKGLVLVDSNPDKFENYLSQLMAKNEVAGCDITFINAWNEWGEGMHLEPDERYGYKYLEAIMKAKNKYSDYIPFYREKIDKDAYNFSIVQKRCNKFELYMNCLDRWMGLLENGISLDKWILSNGYKTIGVYGYGIMGRHLIDQLSKSEVKVAFVIDQQKGKFYLDVPVIGKDDTIPECDVIIVSAFYFFDEIKNRLSTDVKIISLHTILMES